MILFTAILIAAVGLSFIESSAFDTAPSYHLIYETDETTEETGSTTLKCSGTSYHGTLPIAQVIFSLNRTSPADSSIRERGDIRVVNDGCCRIRFNLTRRLEGYYTCGKRLSSVNVSESWPQLLQCKWVSNQMILYPAPSCFGAINPIHPSRP
jgi:hypothetical protein